MRGGFFDATHFRESVGFLRGFFLVCVGAGFGFGFLLFGELGGLVGGFALLGLQFEILQGLGFFCPGLLRGFLRRFLQFFVGEGLGEGFLFFGKLGGLVGGLGFELGFGFDLGFEPAGFFFGEFLRGQFLALTEFGLGFFRGALALVLTAFEFGFGLHAGAFADGGFGLGLLAFLGFLGDAARVVLDGAAFGFGGFLQAAVGFGDAVGGFARVAFGGVFAEAGDLVGNLFGLLWRIGFGTRLSDDGGDARGRGLGVGGAGGLGDFQVGAEHEGAGQSLRKIHNGVY